MKGKKLRQARKAVRLTQKQLGARLGVSAGLIGHWETGHSQPSYEQERQLIDALAVATAPKTGNTKKSRRTATQVAKPLNGPFGSDATPDSNSLGSRIKRSRLEQGWSQEELATKVGTYQTVISQWETGRAKPNRQYKRKLESVLGLSGSAKDDGIDGVGAVAAWLRRARTEAGLSVPELADRAAVTPATIYNVESGRSRNPHSSTVLKLEGALAKQVPDDVKEEVVKEATIAGVGALVDFDPHKDDELPDLTGVYVFYDISDRPIYVGKAFRQTIKKRVKQHDDKFWFKKPIVNHGAYIEVGNETLCDQIEQILIKFLKSNAVINKQHVDR